MNNLRRSYYVRVTNVAIFNALVHAAETMASEKNATFEARRSQGYFELVTSNQALWNELYLYGQLLAQSQDENVEGGEERPG